MSEHEHTWRWDNGLYACASCDAYHDEDGRVMVPRVHTGLVIVPHAANAPARKSATSKKKTTAKRKKR